MDRPIDSHQWASKVEAQRLLSGKPELKIKNDAQTAKEEPALRVISLPHKVSSFLRWIAK